jgi:uncharacterized membrane protein
MTPHTLSRSVAVGAMTGMRSMSGLAFLTWRHGGALARVFAMMAVGEMVVDKMPGVGDRTEALPLTGRLVLGACAGGYVARTSRTGMVAGAVLGAASALITAHLGTQARKHLNFSNGVGGLLEDVLVVALGSLATSRGSR